MAASNQILLDTHFVLLMMGSFNAFLHQKLVLFVHLFCGSVSTLFLALFQLFNRPISRVKDDDFAQRNYSSCSELSSNCKEQEVNVTEFEEANENVVSDNQEEEEEEEEEKPKFVFKFEYQTCREKYEPTVSEILPSTTTNKYEFLSSKMSNLYMEKPEVFSFTVSEFVDNFTANKEEFNGILADDNAAEAESKDGIVEAETFVEGSILGSGIAIDEKKNNALSNRQVSEDDEKFLSEKDFVALYDSDADSDSDSCSITSSQEVITSFVTSTSDGFFSDKDIDDAFEFSCLMNTKWDKPAAEEEMELNNINNYPNSSSRYDCHESNNEEQVNNNSEEEEEVNFDDKEAKDSEKSASQDSSEDSNGLETLWEHQELIEQLKMELKKVRATGLPTILEDHESPKIMEDLKPWKIDEKFQYADRMGELHKFYRCYSERMRKLDILNYQKMYALSFLQSKDPLKSIGSNEASSRALTSLLAQIFQLGKRKKFNSDPLENFIKDLHSDLEMVYVGQMCLSWEILHWQYVKVLEIWDSDPYRLRRYNQVAGELQQFQVLMQRFIENEPFEGPRVQSYVKNRCTLRSLLQVPAIREDGIKDRKGRRKIKEDDYAIKSDSLVEIMEESIRIFWRFLRADKEAHNVIQKSRRGSQIEPQDPIELELLTEVRTSLQMKEKRLKERLRRGNCILRRLQKSEGESSSSSDQVLYFFSQVDMKLVGRVLNMSRITTDQLIWCSNKLQTINFVNRKKIHVEPSFLLFPC